MLVSGDAGATLRAEVASGMRPCPDYIRLEELHGVRLLDWSGLGAGSGHRSVARSARHVAAAVPRVRRVAAVLSDGEHLGIPLAVVMRTLRIDTPHAVIGHNLLTPSKTRLFRYTGAQQGMRRILVHSPNQVEHITRELHVPPSLLRVLPYGVDTEFWSPQPVEEADLVVAAGREHRDYQSLVDASDDTGRVFIADDSPHSPNARRRDPARWPTHIDRRAVSLLELRSLYNRAAVVVVPVLATESPFGITSLLEAMSMGKAIVVSGTAGLRGIIDDGETGLVVPPGDVVALRGAIRHLRGHAADRQRLGEAAREVATGRYGLDAYVGHLARHLDEVC